MKKFINDHNISKNLFAEKCAIHRNTLSGYLNGASEPNTKVLRTLKTHYPSLNLNWLITGHGSPRTRVTKGV
ncbi:MAG: helix-turn-helix transcriptional regulator [Deltaproteobacteria bacterium]|nr:helix-turn-helix transcriptional regulator [Deltaproteobacteria bacterium]